jgi:REP element-mobilizing transposase RayT
MPQSLANVLIHLVFSTRDRVPSLTNDVRQELFPYLGGLFRNIDCPVLQIGGVEDHVHILFRMSRTITLAQVVEKTKTSTSRWLKTKGKADFAWQAVYGVFSVSQSQADLVIAYIQRQEEHHRVVSFQDELRQLFAEAGVEFDERYVWD